MRKPISTAGRGNDPAGSGFGLETAMRLAEKGFEVVAAVEIYAQVQPLKRAASNRGVTLQVEKLDVTDDGDRKKALAWDIEILVNNAGVLEGGSVVDIPGQNMRLMRNSSASSSSTFKQAGHRPDGRAAVRGFA